MHRYMHLVGCTAIATVLGAISCTIEDAPTEGDLDIERGGAVEYPLCRRHSFDINPRRSLFETHVEALEPFTMAGVLKGIAANSSLVIDPVATHDFLFDTYAVGPGLPGSPQHCDDETAFGGGPGLNGFPLQCPRAEQNRVGDIEGWFPLAAVNRFDLAPANGRNCGEARLVLAHEVDRVYTIFEAKIPNPHPQCGIDACAPVQHFWAALTDIDDPHTRAKHLWAAYIGGHPFLKANGFAPFFNFDAFKAGAGQVRTNNFNQGPWTLREFKAVRDNPGNLRFREVPVAANPFGQYFNDALVVPNGDACRKALIETVADIVDNNVNLMAVDVPQKCLAAESPDSAVQQYPTLLQAGSGLETALVDEALAAGIVLTGDEIARRMQFAGACIGCHRQTNGQSLGDGVTAPSSLDFVHTTELLPFENCGDGDISCWVISPALKTAFLPFRKQVVDNYLNDIPCCRDTGPGPIGPGPIGPGPGSDAEDPLSLGAPDLPLDTINLDDDVFLALEAELDAQQPPFTVSGAPTWRVH